MTLVKFSNGRTNKVFKPVYNDVFESLFNTDSFLTKDNQSRIPAVNISESENGFQIELAAPGLKKEDFKISLDQDLLSISADKSEESVKSDEEKKYNRKEYSYSSFLRTFTLPETADSENIVAEYSDGVLNITVAKKEEAKVQSREIAIS